MQDESGRDFKEKHYPAEPSLGGQLLTDDTLSKGWRVWTSLSWIVVALLQESLNYKN